MKLRKVKSSISINSTIKKINIREPTFNSGTNDDVIGTVRITESGLRRITESGAFRILE